MCDQEQFESTLEFLHADLDLCKTFVELAKTEAVIGQPDAAQRVLAKAEQGYATVARMLLKLDASIWQNEILKRLEALRTASDDAQQRLGIGSAAPGPLAVMAIDQ
jgi:protein-disulfide isomerase